MFDEGMTAPQISKELGVHTSTIYREMKRGEIVFVDNHKEIKKYSALLSEEKYQEQLKRKGPQYKIETNVKLAELIEETIIKKKYSPEATLMYIQQNHPEIYKDGICLRTLYQGIDKGLFPNLSNKHLHIKRNREMQI